MFGAADLRVLQTGAHTGLVEALSDPSSMTDLTGLTIIELTPARLTGGDLSNRF